MSENSNIFQIKIRIIQVLPRSTVLNCYKQLTFQLSVIIVQHIYVKRKKTLPLVKKSSTALVQHYYLENLPLNLIFRINCYTY